MVFLLRGNIGKFGEGRDEWEGRKRGDMGEELTFSTASSRTRCHKRGYRRQKGKMLMVRGLLEGC